METSLSFFNRRLIGPGTEVSLDLPVPSKWTIITKLSETSSQMTTHELKVGISGLSYAQVLLLCRNVANEDEQACMRDLYANSI
jgi:hypothetical protein